MEKETSMSGRPETGARRTIAIVMGMPLVCGQYQSIRRRTTDRQLGTTSPALQQ